jgi:hypothetical protein
VQQKGTTTFADIRDHPIPTGAIASLVPQLEVRSPQRGQALLLTFGLRNEGREAVAVLNPFELVQFRLLGDDGRPLHLPSRAPSILIHTQPGSSWKLETGIPIVLVERNGEPGNRAELDAQVIQLAPGDSWAAMYALEGSLNSDQLEPLSAGRYTISCVVTLIDAADSSQSRVLQSDAVVVEYMPSR